jgi:iron complex outermembrane receptor protein
MNNTPLSSALLLGVFVLAIPDSTRAQVAGGADLSTVRGIVSNRGGSPIANASVTLQSKALAKARVATTDLEGKYQFNQLPPGEFQIRAEAAGFRMATQSDLRAVAGKTQDIEFLLDRDAVLDGPFQIRGSVEVTATRSEVGTDDSPASSTVVLREDMEKRNLRSVDQALNNVEGVYSYRIRGVPDNEVGIGMRGFSGRGTGQSRVLILLDGQPVNNSYTGAVNWTGLPLSEVDRVEVARGPFSALYGGNAMGGVVNVITRPIGKRTAEFATQYGSYGTANYSGRGGMRIRERLGIAIGFDGLRTDGYLSQDVLRTATVSNPTAGTQVTGIDRYLTRTGGVNYGVGFRGPNTADRYAVRSRAEYTFGEQTFGSFQYIRQGNEFGWGPYRSSVRAADGRILDSGNVVFQDGNTWMRTSLLPSQFLGVVGGGVSNTYQGQLLTSSRHGQWRFQGGVNDLPREWSGTADASATLAGGPGTETVQSNRGGFLNAQWTHRLRARHAVAVGSDVRLDQAEISVFPTTQYLGGGRLSTRNTYTLGRATTYAVYAQDQFTLSERISLTFGGRYDAWRTFDGLSQPAVGAATVQFPARSASALTGKVAALVKLRAGSNLRFSTGTAFRTPSVFDLYRDLRLASGTLLLGNVNLRPERMTSWEVGIQQDVQRWLRAEVGYYENYISDLIFRSIDLAADPTGFTQRMLNAGRSRAKGVEVALTMRPTSWLQFRPTYTFSSSRISRNDLSPTTVGSQLPFVPRHNAGGTLTGGFRRLTAQATGRFQTAVFATDTNTDTTKGVPGAYDGFVEIDTSVNYNASRLLTFSAGIDNLLDRRYFMFYRNPGRTVFVGLRFRWDEGKGK